MSAPLDVLVTTLAVESSAYFCVPANCRSMFNLENHGSKLKVRARGCRFYCKLLGPPETPQKN
eukprot:6477492-Amphidinium_carterae.1